MKIGPTWQRDENGWVLPELTLGWQCLGWSGRWLRDQSGDDWQFTMEQARFLLWYYAVDESGRWLNSSSVLQRLKGWGKDPLAAAVSAFSCFGPSMFSHFDGDTPVGAQNPAAWVQLVAVSQEQTKNTMKLFPSLFKRDALDEYGIQIGRLNVWGLGDSVQIEAITSSPLAVEGGRPTQVVRNETQNWNSSNQGHDLAGAVDGNVAKSRRGTARILDICNAYRPGEDSVAERMRETYENAQAAGINIGLMYDSLEAPPDAPLTLDAAPDVLEAVRGDAWWLDTGPDGEVLKSIAKTSNSPSESRRKWFNQITATADAWVVPQDWDLCGPRQGEPKPSVDAGEQVVLFFDGSKSDDATALCGCRLSDGLVFVVGVWQRPPQTKEWVVDRAAVDRKVRAAHDLWDVRGFWADLSDARDDETGARYWEPYADAWARDFGAQYTLQAVPSGPFRHAVNWDMRGLTHQKLFVEHAERFTSDVEDGTLTHDGNEILRQHVRNARRRPGKFGIGLGKEHRESARKVDAAVCAVGARMMWHMWLAIPKPEPEPTGAFFL
ncbi:hypothetical protein JTZ10_21660 [Gordonia rubripertincta]|uniref:Terminase n=1 Tax=Gordonia rubripertincta TaxID=36822 RepID=A0AAW4GB73_GORRU|nr:hypothetical protein [Gordonia rubripertincta]MBM7280355.1 hypothetical protein [Gordonia rubripertincta]